jgi:hypothetical protein
MHAANRSRPAEAAAFGQALDAALKLLSEDHAAHRADGFGLHDPEIRLLRPGSFEWWIAQPGHLGGQNKVPRVIAGPDSLTSPLAGDWRSRIFPKVALMRRYIVQGAAGRPSSRYPARA